MKHSNSQKFCQNHWTLMCMLTQRERHKYYIFTDGQKKIDMPTCLHREAETTTQVLVRTR
jgi:hypothetical protein